MPSPDELADALFDGEFPWEFGYEWKPISRGHLRTLARDAAKQALLDAADEAIEFSPNGRYVADWLRARAEQIGEQT